MLTIESRWCKRVDNTNERWEDVLPEDMAGLSAPDVQHRVATGQWVSMPKLFKHSDAHD